MFNNLKKFISRNLTNACGWRTDRKIIVIESDDWGTIRMPNAQTKREYERLGYSVSQNPYCTFDTLADSEDLETLFKTLSEFKDKNGNNAIVTFNTVVANPDFIKIKDSNFEEYWYEPFTETLKRYYPNDNVFDLWKQGIKDKLIKPQFHGREHVNVPLWLEELKRNNKPLLDAFHLNFWGIPKEIYKPLGLNIQASFDSNEPEHINFYKDSIADGLKMFRNLFGFKSTTFIANNYTWSDNLNSILNDNGIKGFQSMKYQKLPFKNIANKERPKTTVYGGKVNEIGQIYLVRNCVFEPSQYNRGFDNIGNCIKQIEQAFFFKKPAIIASHRLNFIGQLSKKNRTENLRQFNILLNTILKKWPSVEFLTSDELVEIIQNGKRQ